MIDKSQAVVGGTLGEGVEGTGLSGVASFALGVARRATPTHCSASCLDCAKVSKGRGGAKEVHPLEASRALKRVSAHIKVADGTGVPRVRMVADGARVRMDIATNKEQSQDKKASKGVRSIRRGAAQLRLVNGQPSEKTVRDNGGDLSVEPLGRSVLPF